MRSGVLRIRGDAIEIDVPAHVAIRLRRNFGGIQRRRAGAFAISATAEVAYDLEWFRQRYPIDVDPESEERYRALVAQHERKLAGLREMEAEGYVPRDFALALPPREYQRVAAELALKTGGLLIADSMGVGKQHPVDTKILTPRGYVAIGDLKVGDEVIGSDGKPTAVTGVYPQGVKPSYRLWFSDDSSVEAGPDHLWSMRMVVGLHWETIVLTTEQLSAVPRDMDLHLPILGAPVEFSGRVGGLVVVTQGVTDRHEFRPGRIPSSCMRAPVDDRIELLHRMLDGRMDGDPRSGISFRTIHSDARGIVWETNGKELAEDVVELVEQLGGTASMRHRKSDHQVLIRLPPKISPPRMARHHPPTRSFVRAEYVRDVESVCISVAAPDRLYATEHAILTHNTVTAICMMTAPGTQPVLVVTMSHLTRQWERELARFAPSLRVHRIRSGQPYKFADVRVEVDQATKRRRVVKYDGVPDVLLINYHKLHGWADTLAERVRTVVFDEAQELRHGGTKKYGAAKAIAAAADHRVGLTATPIYNYGAEIYSVMDVIAPGSLGTNREFLDEWCGGDREGLDPNKARVKDPAALGTYLRESGLMIRRTRQDVGRELPELTVVRHSVEADANSIYRATADVAELAQRVLDRIGTPTEQMRRAGELDYRLRQATGIAKAGAVADFVRLLVDSGEQVALFGWHHEVYSLWCSAFDRPGAEIPYALYTGQQSEAQKDAARKRFVEGEAKVLIISLRAGAGLDGLQHVCRTGVAGELDWSPAVMHQDAGRLHRDGQQHPVMFYVMVADEGSDPVISDVLGIKEAQAAGIRDPDSAGEPVLTGASDDHVRKLAESVLKRAGRVVDN